MEVNRKAVKNVSVKLWGVFAIVVVTLKMAWKHGSQMEMRKSVVNESSLV